MTPGTCVRGHARTPDNLTANKSCKECNRLHAKASGERKRIAAGREARVYSPDVFPCGHARTAEHMRAGRTDCLTCHKAREKARYHTDPDRYRAAASEWQRANRQAATDRQRQWRHDNAEHYRAYSRKMMRDRTVGKRDPDTVAYLDIIMRDPCVYCGAPAEHVDHIEPRSAGGENHWTNYAPACASCNQSKHAKPLLSFLLARVQR